MNIFTRRPLIIISSICILIRLLYNQIFNNFEHIESSAYWKLSDSLIESGILGFNGNSSTSYEPVYPYILFFIRSLFYDSVFLVVLFQIICATISGYFTYKISCKLTSNKVIGYLAFFIFSIHPYLIMQSTTIVDITLFITFLTIFVYLLLDDNEQVYRVIIAGFVLGLAVGTRSVAFPLFIVVCMLLLLRKNFKKAAVLTFSFSLLFVLFGYRNYRIDGSFFPPTRGGWNLLKGNNDIYDQMLPEYSVDLLAVYITQNYPDSFQSASEYDNELNKKAYQFIKNNPFVTLKNIFRKLFYFYYPKIIPYYPMSTDSVLVVEADNTVNVTNAEKREKYKEIIYSVFAFFLLIGTVCGVYLRRNSFRNDSLMYCVISTITLVHVIYWPATRFRMQIEFVMIFFSACFIYYLFKRFNYYKEAEQ